MLYIWSMKTIRCQVCKATKRVQDSAVGKYCSRDCRSAAANRVESNCSNCGDRVVLLKSQTTSAGRGSYCSKACQVEHKRRQSSICENCRKDFKAPNPDQRFCSRSCRGATFIPPKHIDGRSTHQHYECWYNMVQRCTKPSHPQWEHYGGRGITVCEEWLTPANFYQHLDEVLGSRGGRSLDRIDNNGNYEPGNVRWATAQEQVRNRRAYVVNPQNPRKPRKKFQLRQLGPNAWAIGRF